MLLHDDVLYQILQWLPVKSLLRFKLACRTWRALIESNDFIKQHLHHHHYDPNLKDKSHNLIRMVGGKKSPFTFPLISLDSSEEPNTCIQLDLSYLREYFPLDVLDTASYNGIVCFSFLNCKRKYSVCLWNPATRQSRVLPQSPATFTLKRERFCLETWLGLGFDVKSNDYKVVNLCRNQYNNEERVEVYSLNTDSWRSVTTVFPVRGRLRSSRIPFNNGTCFFWSSPYFKGEMILCFDFTSEKFRSIPFPNVGDHLTNHYAYAIVASDKIACVSHSYEGQTKIWVLDGYGSRNQSWVELYTIDPLSTIERKMSVMWLFMKGDYLFMKADTMGWTDRYNKDVCRYNVVTKEIKNLSTVEVFLRTCSEKWNSYGLRIRYLGSGNLVDYKESLLSVGKGSKEMIRQMNLEYSV